MQDWSGVCVEVQGERQAAFLLDARARQEQGQRQRPNGKGLKSSLKTFYKIVNKTGGSRSKTDQSDMSPSLAQ